MNPTRTRSLPKLKLKFRLQQMVGVNGEVAHGDCLVLELAGQLFDGTPIIGEDVVTVKKPGKK